MEIIRLSDMQIQWDQELLCYDFKIDYHSGIKNPANVLSQPFINKNAEKKLV